MFGEFIAVVYDALPKRLAKRFVRLMVNVRLIEFRGPRRFEIS